MNELHLSRRRFLATTSMAASCVWLNPYSLIAQTTPQNTSVSAVVVKGRAAGATAKIKTQSLRGNVSALIGSGGNIAVLPGKDGKLLIDSGYSTSQPQITVALDTISGDPPLRQLI